MGARLQEALPRLILIADRFIFPEIADKTLTAVQAGVPWVHLRDHAVSTRHFLHAARDLHSDLQGCSASLMFTINRRLDPALALDAHFHTGAKGPSIEEARVHLPDERLLGYSVHCEEEGLKAREAGADYVFYSPIYPTRSKPGHPGIGLEELATFCAAVAPLPVYALGGISPKKVEGCLKAGAYGVAVISCILKAKRPIPAIVETLHRQLASEPS